jgi:hypothetical protein
LIRHPLTWKKMTAGRHRLSWLWREGKKPRGLERADNRHTEMQPVKAIDTLREAPSQ